MYSHTHKIYYVVHTQNCHTFYYVFFPYKNVSVFLHTQKYYVIHAKITSIFTIQKLLCITRTQKLPYKNVSVFLHTQKYYVIHAKITSIFTIQKLLCIARTQKIAIQKMLVFFPYKNYYVVHTYKNY